MYNQIDVQSMSVKAFDGQTSDLLMPLFPLYILQAVVQNSKTSTVIMSPRQIVEVYKKTLFKNSTLGETQMLLNTEPARYNHCVYSYTHMFDEHKIHDGYLIS